MKSIPLFIAVILMASTTSLAQSQSYQTLKNKFKGQPDVHSFYFSGWMARLVLKMADEDEVVNAIKDLQYMRLMTIPRAEFSAQQVTVQGFKRVLKQDSFEELATIRDHGEEVTIYLREGNNNKNNYIVLVEEESEVVAIELKGYLDPKLLNSPNATLAINK